MSSPFIPSNPGLTHPTLTVQAHGFGYGTPQRNHQNQASHHQLCFFVSQKCFFFENLVWKALVTWWLINSWASLQRDRTGLQVPLYRQRHRVQNGDLQWAVSFSPWSPSACQPVHQTQQRQTPPLIQCHILLGFTGFCDADHRTNLHGEP